MYTEDTIAAIATAPGVGGVGIIRVSGPAAFDKVDAIFSGIGTVSLKDRPDRTIQYGRIIDPSRDGAVVDEVLVLLMQGPHSYTAEDVVEIQCHGGSVAIREILGLVLRQGVRLAEPGEFTRRAFLNGRIDLTQAEAIIDIIEAKSEKSLSVAVNQLDGTLTRLIRTWRSDMVALIARMEVAIDYPEEDIEDITLQEAEATLAPLAERLDELLATAETGRLLRDGIMTAIIGCPNAGKSSLMNAVLRENRAIVTDIPGTTRDSIEEGISVEGISLRLVDTAGIRETDDTVEKIGVAKAKEYLDKSDIVICVIDASKPLTADETAILKSISGRYTLVFLNKADLGLQVTEDEVHALGDFTAIVPISAANGEGRQALSKVVTDLVYGGSVRSSQEAMLSNVRHITLVKQAAQQLAQARESIAMGLSVDCVVTDLREAWETLGQVTGDTIRESLTDELFSRFCLGK